MRAILGGAAVLVLALAGGAAGRDDAIDAKKLVGVWEPTEVKKDASVTMEFTADGKVVLAARAKGAEFKFDGTYKVTGNTVRITNEVGGKEKVTTLTVEKLTDSEMTAKNDKGKSQSFKRVKGK